MNDLTTPAKGSAMTTTTLRHVDPRELVVDGGNVRSMLDLDEAFVQSIRERGVLVPITAVDYGDGWLTVLMGHRRTAAAIEAGLDTVPVALIEGDVELGGRDSDPAERIIDQLAENDHRRGVSSVDRIHAVEQLALFGLPASAIAKHTAMSKGDVEKSMKVAKSSAASLVAEKSPTLTLDQLAAIAEFEDDPDVVDELTGAAERGQFDWALQRARENAESARLVAARIAELESQGKRAVEVGYDRAGTDQPTVALEYLRAVKDHETCPGHAIGVWSSSRWEGNQRFADTAEAAVCVDWRDHGHTHIWERPEPSDEDRVAREQELAERKRQEEQRREAMATAAEVRRNFIKDSLLRGKLPTDWPWVVFEWASEDLWRTGDMVAEFLGEELGDLDRTRNNAAARALLAIALAKREDHLGESWAADATTKHLEWLKAQGYTLSEVEAEMAGEGGES